MEGVALQKERMSPFVVMGDVDAVVETEGVDLPNQSLEGMGGVGLPLPPIVHQILIAKQQRFLHVLVKRKEMDGADSHEDFLVGMVVAGLPLAHQCLAQTMRMSQRKVTAGADLHKPQDRPLIIQSRRPQRWGPKTLTWRNARFVTHCAHRARVAVNHRKESATSVGIVTTGMMTSLKMMVTQIATPWVKTMIGTIRRCAAFLNCKTLPTTVSMIAEHVG